MYVDQNLYHGRPASGQRLDKELRCYDLLDRLGLTYDRADHDAADTIEACAAVEDVLGAGICKNLFRTKDLSHQIGSARLSFAAPEHMLELLDITPGSVSVLGLMNDHDGRVRLLIDRDLLKDAYLCCHPCINTSTLKLRMADAIDVLIPAMKHAPTYVDLPVYEPQA
jgi:Ala-tRNA(Pro) deacylase